MLASTRKPEIEFLTQQLNSINEQFRTSIDYEMQRLKQEEIELQNALKLRTRQEFIRSLDRELLLEDLDSSASDLRFTSNSYSNLKATYPSLVATSKDYTTEFLTSDTLDENLRKSHQVLDKLIQDYDSAREFLKESANSSTFKNKYIDNDRSKVVKPNVVFATKKKKYPTSTKTIRIYRDIPTQYLNQQQTLVHSKKLENELRSKSINDINRSILLEQSNNPYANSIFNEREYAKAIRDSYFYSDKEKINGVPKSVLKNTYSSYMKIPNPAYTTLPVSKTLIHNKPWSYGKVECNYYPFRDNKIKK